jgi:hypothetical protein
MFKLTAVFVAAKLGVLAGGSDLIFYTCMLVSVTGEEGRLAMAAIEEWCPVAIQTALPVPHKLPPINAQRGLLSINAASSRPDQAWDPVRHR